MEPLRSQLLSQIKEGVGKKGWVSPSARDRFSANAMCRDSAAYADDMQTAAYQGAPLRPCRDVFCSTGPQAGKNAYTLTQEVNSCL